jgi:hypothetical protein
MPAPLPQGSGKGAEATPLPKTQRQGKKKTQPTGQAINEIVASSWAYAVKAPLALLGAYAALTAPTPPLLGYCRLAGKAGFW